MKELDENGFAILNHIYSADEVAGIIAAMNRLTQKKRLFADRRICLQFARVVGANSSK